MCPFIFCTSCLGRLWKSNVAFKHKRIIDLENSSLTKITLTQGPLTILFFLLIPFFLLHLSCSGFQEVWSILCLPPMDALPPTTPDMTFAVGMLPAEEWPHLLSPLFYIFGAAVAYWGSTLLRLIMRLVSLILAPLHRYGWTFKHRNI